MSKNSRTLVEIDDNTQLNVGIDVNGLMHIIIGSNDEHQVIIKASAHYMASLAIEIVGRLAGYNVELERNIKLTELELGKWVNS